MERKQSLVNVAWDSGHVYMEDHKFVICIYTKREREREREGLVIIVSSILNFTFDSRIVDTKITNSTV